MAWKEIKNDAELGHAAALFEKGAALVSVTYTACNKNSAVNDVRTAILSFASDVPFRMKFEGINCLHVVPISTGSIAVKNVSLGKFGKFYFWADDAFFNVTMPDTSLTYIISEKVFVEI